MSDDVTVWIRALADNDDAAIQKIWERYYSQLLALARGRLGNNRRMADEEDAVLSAFNSFYQGLQSGRFPRLNDRHDLWKVLLTLTARKTTQYRRRGHADKRGGGNVRGESVFVGSDTQDAVAGINAATDNQPTPEFAALVAEQCDQLLASLDDDAQRQIALLKLEGYTNPEISEQLGCGLRTVERKLTKIRDKWARHGKERQGRRAER